MYHLSALKSLSAVWILCTTHRMCASLYVRLQAALSSQLVLQEVSVVRRRDEVVAEWLAHVLVQFTVLRFKYGALLGAQVHLETI